MDRFHQKSKDTVEMALDSCVIQNGSNTLNWQIPGQYLYDGCVMGGMSPRIIMSKLKFYDGLESGDCLVAGYPKTGSTLCQEICYMVQNGGDLQKVNKDPIFDRIPFLEQGPEHRSGMERIRDLGGPRTIKTHVCANWLPHDIPHKGVKIVFVCRNPKDMLVSAFHFYRSYRDLGYFPGNWNDFFELFLKDGLCYGNYFSYLKNWIEVIKTNKYLLVKYEDIVKQKRDTIIKIAKYLNKELDSKAIDNIVQHTSFDSMQKNPQTNFKQDKSPIDSSISQFMRKGEVGDWKNYFTIAQSEIFDKIYGDEMKDIGFGFSFE